MTSVVFFGIGSALVVEYVETCRRLSYRVAVGVANRDGPAFLPTTIPSVEIDDIQPEVAALPFFCPLFTPANRYIAVNEAFRAGFKFQTSMVDPTAIVASDLVIGAGSFVNAGAIIGACSILDGNVVVNRGATIGHHAQLEEFVSIGPGATLAGQITVGRGAMIGAGAIITPGTTIGEHAVVGAGSVVTGDVPAFVKTFGAPAKPVGGPLRGFQTP